MYEASRSAILLAGASFSVEQGVAQGCSLSPIRFLVFINDLEGSREGRAWDKVGDLQVCCSQMIL